MLPPLPQICALLIVCALYIGTFFTYNHPMTKKLINSKRASNNTKPQHDESLELFVNESLENSAERHWVLAERRRHVTQFCQRRLAQGGWPYLERDFTERNLVFVEKFNLSYCPIGKTGTSTWFARFSNSSERQDEHIRRRFFSSTSKSFLLLGGSERRRRFGGSFSFLFVRHPFLRLVSAYQQKVVDRGARMWVRLIKEKIAENRNQSKAKLSTLEGFPILVDFLLQGIPRFRNNTHLRGYFEKCPLCNYDFNAIGKMETMAEDERFILRRTRMSIKDPSTSKVKENPSSGGSTASLARKYFSTLSKDQLEGLKQLYKEDFHAFQYNPNIFDEQFLKETDI